MYHSHASVVTWIIWPMAWHMYNRVRELHARHGAVRESSCLRSICDPTFYTLPTTLVDVVDAAGTIVL